MFRSLMCHFGPTCCAQSGSWIGFGGNGNLMQKKGLLQLARNLGNFGKGRGAPYNNLWSGALLGHGASLSLVIGKKQTGHAMRSKRGGG